MTTAVESSNVFNQSEFVSAVQGKQPLQSPSFAESKPVQKEEPAVLEQQAELDKLKKQLSQL